MTDLTDALWTSPNPRTPEGLRLWDRLCAAPRGSDDSFRRDVGQRIEQIEAEASRPLREAAQAALDLLPELSVAYHQVGSLRDHADPKDKTGWNLHGIETCEDTYCLDALATIAALDRLELAR